MVKSDFLFVVKGYKASIDAMGDTKLPIKAMIKGLDGEKGDFADLLRSHWSDIMALLNLLLSMGISQNMPIDERMVESALSDKGIKVDQMLKDLLNQMIKNPALLQELNEELKSYMDSISISSEDKKAIGQNVDTVSVAKGEATGFMAAYAVAKGKEGKEESYSGDTQKEITKGAKEVAQKQITVADAADTGVKKQQMPTDVKGYLSFDKKGDSPDQALKVFSEQGKLGGQEDLAGAKRNLLDDKLPKTADGLKVVLSGIPAYSAGAHNLEHAIPGLESRVSQASLNALPLDASPVKAQDVISQIVDGARFNIDLTADKYGADIKLKPESLGNISLNIEIDKGIMMAKIEVQNYQVKQVIESNLMQLRDALQNQGINVQSISVTVDTGTNDQLAQSNGGNQWNEGKRYGFDNNKIVTKAFDDVAFVYDGVSSVNYLV